jgi:hypothetical protein
LDNGSGLEDGIGKQETEVIVTSASAKTAAAVTTRMDQTVSKLEYWIYTTISFFRYAISREFVTQNNRRGCSLKSGCTDVVGTEANIGVIGTGRSD